MFPALFPESVKTLADSGRSSDLFHPWMPSRSVYMVWNSGLGLSGDFPLCMGENLQQRVCSGIAPDSLFIEHSEAGGGCETKILAAKVGIISIIVFFFRNYFAGPWIFVVNEAYGMPWNPCFRILSGIVWATHPHVASHISQRKRYWGSQAH